MMAEEMAVLPPRPEEVAEWEELLLRLEIVPRVVRNQIDEPGDPEIACEALAEAVVREADVGRWLEAVSSGGAATSAEPDGRLTAEGEDMAALSLRFASLRARTFAMVQRRGLDVWEWRGPVNGGVPITVHQLLSWLAQRDGQLLARLRDSTRGGRSGC